MSVRVVVTGRGLICALGDEPGAVHRAACEGQSALAPVDGFEPAGLTRPLGFEVKNFKPKEYLGKKNMRPLDRTARLLATATHLALADAGWAPEARAEQEIGLVLGSMYGSVRTIAEFDRRAVEAGPMYASPLDFANTVINAAAGQTAIWHGLRGINSTISAGQSSGLQAIAYAAGLIRAGRAPVLLAGGAEELCLESFLAMERAGLIATAGEEAPVPFGTAGGFLPGEGAALLVLEDAEVAARRGARVLAEVRGAALGFDPSVGRDADAAVETSASAIRAALADAGIGPGDVGAVGASANGGPLDALEARALHAALGDRSAEVPVAAIKGCLGETLGADGGLQAVVAVESLRSGRHPGVRGLEPGPDFPLRAAGPEPRPLAGSQVLLDSFGWDGRHSALVVGAASGE